MAGECECIGGADITKKKRRLCAAKQVAKYSPAPPVRKMFLGTGSPSALAASDLEPGTAKLPLAASPSFMVEVAWFGPLEVVLCVRAHQSLHRTIRTNGAITSQQHICLVTPQHSDL